MSEYSKKYYKENRELLLKKRKAYREKNKEEVARKHKKYMETYPKAKRKEQSQRYYKENKDRICEYIKEYHKKYPEKKKELDRKYILANKDKVSFTKKKSALKLKMTYEEFCNYRSAVENSCEICGRQETKESISIDHCHTKGHFRGLLCKQCNIGLGMFKDDTAIMTKAINYLIDRQKPREQS